MKRVANRVRRTWWKAVLAVLGVVGANSVFACAYGAPEYGIPVPECTDDRDCARGWYCDRNPDGGVGICEPTPDGGN